MFHLIFTLVIVYLILRFVPTIKAEEETVHITLGMVGGVWLAIRILQFLF